MINFYLNQFLIFWLCAVMAQPAFAVEKKASEKNMKDVPPGWVKLMPVAPNLATFAFMGDPKNQESFFSIQRHPLDKEMGKLKTKFTNAKGAIEFGQLTAQTIEKDGDCFRLLLTRKRAPASGSTSGSISGSHSLPRHRQTWCFEKNEAWVVIEEGASRVGDTFVSKILRENGFKDLP